MIDRKMRSRIEAAPRAPSLASSNAAHFDGVSACVYVEDMGYSFVLSNVSLYFRLTRLMDIILGASG